MSQILGKLFLKFSIKANINGIFFTHVATLQVQPGEFVSPIPKNMPVFQPCTFHIIFLILWFLLAIDNSPMTRI